MQLVAREPGNLLAIPEKLILLLPSLNRATSKLRNQHPVTNSNPHRQAVTLLVERTRSHGQDLGLVELLDRRLGQEDASRGLGLGLDALDEHAVQKGDEAANGSDGSGLHLCQYNYQVSQRQL